MLNDGNESNQPSGLDSSLVYPNSHLKTIWETKLGKEFFSKSNVSLTSSLKYRNEVRIVRFKEHIFSELVKLLESERERTDKWTQWKLSNLESNCLLMLRDFRNPRSKRYPLTSKPGQHLLSNMFKCWCPLPSLPGQELWHKMRSEQRHQPQGRKIGLKKHSSPSLATTSSLGHALKLVRTLLWAENNKPIFYCSGMLLPCPSLLFNTPSRTRRQTD